MFGQQPFSFYWSSSNTGIATITQGFGILGGVSGGNPGRLSDQGSCGSPNSTANNQFYQNPPGICYGPNSIYSDIGDPANDFTYYQPGNDPYIAHCISGPSPVSVQIASPVTCPITLSSITLGSAGCPFNPPPRIGHSGIPVVAANVTLLGLDVSIAALHDKIDGGNTPGLLAIINDPHNASTTVEQKLIAASPYLSDRVLIAAIIRSPALTNADLESIMLSNSSLSNRVFNKLAETDPTLSADSAVVSAQTGSSKMKDLQSGISDLSIQRNEYIQALVSYYVKQEQWKEAATLLDEHKEYEHAFTFYVRIKDWDKAAEMIAYSQDPDMQVLQGIQLLHAKSNIRIDSLTCLDSVVIAKIGSNPETHAGEVARIWYCSAYHQPFYELTPALDTTHGGGIYSKATHNDSTNSPVSNLNNTNLISIYPNPAQNEVILTIRSGTWGEGTVITAANMDGQKMMTLTPESNTSSVTVNTTTWVNGVYIFTVNYANGKQTAAKVVIIKS